MRILLTKSVKRFYVIYFNGFSLRGEETLFEEYIDKGDISVAGFSFGAQKAFDYVYHSKERVDRLILLSPAFFQTEKPSFNRTQLHYFEAGEKSYVKQFLKNVTHPSNFNLSAHLKVGTKEELKSLLTYKWDKDKIQTVLNKGTSIEVFLGGKDKIINSHETVKFFSSSTVYLLKNSGHLLKESL